MANNDGHPEYGGSEFRRRRPSNHDSDDDYEPQGEEESTTTYNMIDSPRRAASDPSSARHPSASTVETPSRVRPPGSGDPDHPQPRVRFSADIMRLTAPHTARAHRDGDGIELGTMEDPSPVPRPGQPGLRITTRNHNSATGASVMGQATVRSPTSFVSPTSPTSPRTLSQTSPVSPHGRTRGYSLRRSLFRRNLGNTADSPGPGIELQEAAGSSQEFSWVRLQDDDDLNDQSSATAVQIESAPSYEYTDVSEPKFKGVRGISALPHYESWVTERARENVLVHSIKDAYGRARKFILRINEIPTSRDGRHIDMDASRKKHLVDERTGKAYIGNTIRSSRYTAWNFLPRQLFAQFSKLANFYFLCVSILQMIPGLSTTGTYTTIVPLLFFVSISMAKEGYDDLRRYRLDKAENNRDAKVLHAYRPTKTSSVEDGDPDSPQTSAPIHWATKKWKDIEVGDIVKLDRDDAAPADLVLLHSSGTNGIAYVETMALDGETNLKTKQATASLAKRCQNWDQIATCRAHFVVEDPNLDLYNFEGRVTLDGDTAPLTNTEIIYRGSILRNTPEAISMVIYTGEECRIRMNANKNPRIKAPALQTIVNKVVIIIVCFVIALAIFNTVAYQIWSAKTEEKSWYISNADVAFFPILASFVIMFNTMIPLSLYVSLEIIKVCQMFLLNDIDMYDEVSDTPFEARTSTINEELGQVSYIFSDKTGTLTDNSMKFRKMSVAGTAWLHDADLPAENEGGKQLLHKKRSKGKKAVRKARKSESYSVKFGATIEEDELMPRRSESHTHGLQRSGSKWKSSARPAKSQPERLTTEMIRYIQKKPFTVFARKARLFLLAMALCHTCLPEEKENGTIDFQASSPDELALVRAAQELGYMVINRDVGTITLKSQPAGSDSEYVTETYEILDVIEFSSKRKRMSIVVRFPDSRVCIFCKGADSIVMQRLKLATLANKKVVEIERRASKRKSLEAQHAIARKSSQMERRGSLVGRPSLTLGRTSFTLGRSSTVISRTSIGGLGRTSMSGTKLQPIRDELDQWLQERERDVDVDSIEDNTVYYSPRPSAQLGRHSLAVSEARSSMQLDDEDDLVDETLVVDESAAIERCFQHINDFATEGLRTLLYGYRFLSEDEYETWKKVYLDATTSLLDRQNLIEQAGELIERDLDLAGATAIEDKLQKGVPEAIDKLRRANIKMWMLTGDKRETAINIGHSCRLIKDYSTVTVLDQETGEVERHIAAAIVAINEGSVAHSVVVVDGQTLSMIDSDKSLQSLFFDLAILVDSVVCCRASPSQKAGLVKAIRRKVKKSITLAIGDGANDIAMIQEAHVGIGITGKEGLQAARTSDYSIAQFRFLVKLLLVHGRWNYVRTCKYTVGTFWKEMLFYLNQALYQRWAGYTGTSLFEPWSLSMFNTLFTSLPVIFMGIFEKDLAASTLCAVPELYTKGQHNRGFNFKVYAGWMFMAATEAMVVFFTTYGLFGKTVFTFDNGLFAIGQLAFSSCVIMISTKLQILEMHNKSIMAGISFFCSVGGWFLWNMILSQTYHDNTIYNVQDGFLYRFGRNLLWWLTVFLILTSLVAFELTVTALRVQFFTTDADTFQALEKDAAIKRRFEEASAMELQNGWNHGDKKSGAEKERLAREQEDREGEVKELLRNRPSEIEEGRGIELGRRSLDIQEMLSRRFGSVRRE